MLCLVVTISYPRKIDFLHFPSSIHLLSSPSSSSPSRPLALPPTSSRQMYIYIYISNTVLPTNNKKPPRNRFSSTWNKVRSTLRYTPQLARCADALEEGGDLEQDRHLAWLVRLQYVSEELIEAQRGFERGPQDHQSEMQRNLIRVGLEAQVRDFKERMPPQYASTSKFRALHSFPFFSPLTSSPRAESEILIMRSYKKVPSIKHSRS